MRTAQQFSGFAWLSFDPAFRRQAAAYSLNDCSHTHPEVFHFYVSSRVAVEQPTVAAPIRSVSPTEPSRDVEAVEAPVTPSAYSPLLDRQSVFLLVSRCRFCRSCAFPGALHRIVPRWRIRTQTRPPAYHRFNGVGLRTCNSCLDFLLLSGVPGQFFFLRIAFALELRRPRLPLILPFISFRLSVAGRVRRIVAIFSIFQARSHRQSSIASPCYRLHPYRSAAGIITISYYRVTGDMPS